MEEEKKEAVGEPSEAANEQKEEKKNAKVIINQFVEKHGKKKCIIYGSIIGACLLALILGLSIGLSGKKSGDDGDGYLPTKTVDANLWKQRADAVNAQHQLPDYVLPSKVTYTYNQTYYDELDNSADSYLECYSSVNIDDLSYYGKAVETSVGETRIMQVWYYYVEADQAFNLIGEEKIGEKDPVTQSKQYAVSDADLALLKAGDSNRFNDVLYNNLWNFLTSQSGELGDINRAGMSFSISGLVNYISPTRWYFDNYQTAIGDSGVYHTDINPNDAETTGCYVTKIMKLTSSGEGSVGLDYQGEITNSDEYGTKYTGNSYYKLGYKDYNMNYFLTAQDKITEKDGKTYKCYYGTKITAKYGVANNEKPALKNVIA